MPRSISLEINLLACLLLLTSTGCAPMFNAGVNELALEPTSHKQLDRPSNRNLDEFKIDPLRFQDVSASPARSMSEGTKTTEPDSEKSQPAAELVAIPQKKINKLIRLEPIVDFRKKNSSQALSLSDGKSEAAATDETQSESAQQSSESSQVILSPQFAGGGDFVANGISKASTTKALPAVATAADSAPDDSIVPDMRQSENDFGSGRSASEPVSFVSSQMENLVPPFANHPDDFPCVEAVCFNSPPETRTQNEVAQVDAAIDLIPPANEPISQPDNYATLTSETDSATSDSASLFEQVIASTMDPHTDVSVSALVEMPSVPVAMVAARHGGFSESRLTWQNQLRRTIEVFEQEIDHAPDGSESEKLKTGLAILQALETDFNADGMKEDGSVNELKEYWSHQIQAINELLKNSAADSGSNPSASLALEHLHLAVHELAAVADLNLAFAAFCTKVAGFGQYTPFETAEFDSDQSVLVYCEIENFAPLLETRNGNTSYQTRLSSSFWITNDADSIVQQQDYPAVTDNARNLRRDFFMHLPVTFAKLPSGEYALHIKVRDHGSGKIATLEQAMEFSIR